MSADGSALEPSGETVHESRHVRLGDALSHPLLGRHPRRTAAASVTLATLLFTHLASGVAARWLVDLAPPPVVLAFDGLSAVVIAATLAVVVIVPLAYAAWNGGPALAFTLAVSPVVFGEVLAWRFVVDVDAAVGLTIGAAAAALALYADEARTTGSIAPWPACRPGSGGALVTALLVSVSLGSVARFYVGAPPSVRSYYTPFLLFWTLPIAVFGGYLLASLRRWLHPRASPHGKWN